MVYYPTALIKNSLVVSKFVVPIQPFSKEYKNTKIKHYLVPPLKEFALLVLNLMQLLFSITRANF